MRVWLVVAVGALLASGTQPARASEITLAVGATRFSESDYHRTLRAFDREGMTTGLGISMRGLLAPLPWLRVGPRMGWLNAESSPASAEADVQVSRDPLTFDLYDVGGVARFVLPPQRGLRVDVGVELGAAFGTASLRGVGQRIVAPRGELSLFIGYETSQPGVLFGVRGGYQHLPWRGAGVSAADPVFSGYFGSLEGGLVL